MCVCVSVCVCVCVRVCVCQDLIWCAPVRYVVSVLCVQNCIKIVKMFRFLNVKFKSDKGLFVY